MAVGGDVCNMVFMLPLKLGGMRKGLCREPVSVAAWIKSPGTSALLGSARLEVQVGFSLGIFLVACEHFSFLLW